MGKDKDKKKDKEKNSGEDLEKKNSGNETGDENANPENKNEDEMTEETEKTLKMIWLHKKAKPGTVSDVFAYSGIANDEGFFVVDVPKAKVKNELKRKPSLIPYSTYEKQREMEKEIEDLYNE